MKIKTLIIDDEKLARDIIKNYLTNCKEIELIGEASNGFDALKKINTLKPDLIFLDIQMPKLNGFELLELIDNPPLIIFTTAYDEFAIKAFEVSATDYLLKPFSESRFNEAIKKVFKKFNTSSNSIPQQISIESISTQKLNRVVVKKQNNIIILSLEDIIYFEAQDDYVMIYTTKGKFLKQKTMKYFESNLTNDFYRIHRKYILNINYLDKIELNEKSTYQVILKNNLRLPVSKSGYDNLKIFLNQ